MFFKIGILKHFSNFTGKHLCRSLFLNVAGLKACNCTKKKLQNRCFPVKFAKFLRTTLAATSEFCSSSCIITVSVTITRFISNECIKVNAWSIVWYYIHSKIMIKLASQQKFQNCASICTFVAPGFSNMVSFRSVRVFLNFKISFIRKHKFFYWWDMYAMKLKYWGKNSSWIISCSMKCSWNCISWNALKVKFPSVYLL